MEVWSEGYAGSDGRSGALFHGNFKGETLKKAVENMLKTWDQEEVKKYYDPKKLTYWACKFFDNESDARKSFG